jgi:DNA polymerase-3 subunit delta'
MTAAATPWPAALAGSPAVAVIERAIERERLSHSVLLQGDDLPTLPALAYAIADRLLNPPGARSAFAAERHPDCFAIRPVGKLRIIPVESVRTLIAQVQMTPAVATHKVGIVHEADRMREAAANSFLKTLEEPPAHTTLLLLTTRPYDLLPTIRSRVLQFRFPDAAAGPAVEGWSEWLADYAAWLGRLRDGVAGARAGAGEVVTVYGLVARFGVILDRATELAHAEQAAAMPEGVEEEVAVALDAGVSASLRSRLFADIERATRDVARSRLAAGDAAAGRAFPAAIAALERVAGLLVYNLNESAALEDFLLASLRLWTQRER